MKRNMWKRVAAIGLTAGMLISSMPAMAFDDEMIEEDDFYIVAEEETEAEMNLDPEIEEIDVIDQDIISEDESAGAEDDIILDGIVDETEAELYAAAGSDIPIDEDHFPDANFREVISEDYDWNYDGILSADEIAGITDLKVNHRGISTLKGIEYFTSLTKLECWLNNLTSLDVSRNTALEYLECEDNQLTNLDVSKNTALEYLNYSCNKLTSLDVSKNTALEYLDCGSNQITNLDVSKNTALEYLNCSYNKLTNLDVSKNTALERLTCYTNPLTNLDVSNNAALKKLDCTGNHLTSLDVRNNTALEYLDCSSNELTDLDLSNNTALWEYLDCSWNELTDLDLSNNTLLTSLHCQNNQLLSLNVSKNKDLEYLWCFDNQLKSLDIMRCPNLVQAYLHGDCSEHNGICAFTDYSYELKCDKSVKIISDDGGFLHSLDYYATTSSTTYNPELACDLMKLAWDAYGPHTEKDENNVGTDGDIKKDYKALGFDVDNNYCAKNYDKWDYFEDYCGFSFAVKDADDGGQIVVITIRGSVGSLGNKRRPYPSPEWVSNLLSTVPAINFIGWHNGFFNPATEIVNTLAEYHLINTSNTKYFISGHSRGAGVGNVLGVLLSQKGISRENMYVYNFACPDTRHDLPTTDWSGGGKYNNIFNINAANDLVGVVPGGLGDVGQFYTQKIPTPYLWGKYGRTYFYSFDWNSNERSMVNVITFMSDQGMKKK